MALSCPHCKQDLDLLEDARGQKVLKYRKTRELLMAIIIFLGSLYNMSLYSTALSKKITVGDRIIMIIYIPFMAVIVILDSFFRFILGDSWRFIINSQLGLILGLTFGFIFSYLIAKIFYNYSHEDNYLTLKK